MLTPLPGADRSSRRSVSPIQTLSPTRPGHRSQLSQGEPGPTPARRAGRPIYQLSRHISDKLTGRRTATPASETSWGQRAWSKMANQAEPRAIPEGKARYILLATDLDPRIADIEPTRYKVSSHRMSHTQGVNTRRNTHLHRPHKATKEGGGSLQPTTPARKTIQASGTANFKRSSQHPRRRVNRIRTVEIDSRHEPKNQEGTH